MNKEKVIEYVMNSPHNTNRAVLEGLLDGMGGDEYTFLFEEEVTTATENMPFAMGNFSYNKNINANTIKVTFDSVEYQCDLITIDGDSYYGDYDGTSGPNFSEYPFLIVSKSDGGNMIATQTPGTYTVKVEVPQSSSGSSNDWSTAEVTFLNNSTTQQYYVLIASAASTGIYVREISVPFGNILRTGELIPGGKQVTIPLYKQGYILDVNSLSNTNVSSPQVTGDITFSNNEFIITGDCSITLEGGTR